MPENAAPNPQADVDRLEMAADEAVAACGGNARDAVKALIVANEFLESEVSGRIARLRARTLSDLHRIDVRAW